MNKKGVSAVIGVILMVAITVAIAGTVYVYVSDILYDNEEINISGNITDKFIIGYQSPHYFFILDNTIELSVNVTIFYSYDVGEFYNGL